MKRALLVSPSYALDVAASDASRQLMPPDLRKYSTLGFAHDAQRFIATLGHEFAQVTLSGKVLAKDLKSHIEELLSPDTGVAVLLYCGHGMWDGSCNHGTLICSFGQQVAASTIESIAAQQKFKGTFVRVLNMCEAEGKASASNADASLSCHAFREQAKAEWAHSQQQGSSPSKMTPSCPDYHGITVLASSNFGKASGSAKGSKFIDAWAAMFAKVQPVQRLTYQGLLTALRDHYPQANVHMYFMLSCDGILWQPAEQVPHNEAVDAMMKQRQADDEVQRKANEKAQMMM